MDCRRARKLIPCAADGELDETLHTRLSAHLVSCAECDRALDSQRTAVLDLENTLRIATHSIAVPDDFASRVAAQAAAERFERGGILWPLRRQAAQACGWVLATRRAAAVAVGVALSVAVVFTGIALGRALDSSPMAAVRVYSGHLVSFTVNPRPDGSVFAGVDARRYCQVTRSREEALR